MKYKHYNLISTTTTTVIGLMMLIQMCFIVPVKASFNKDVLIEYSYGSYSDVGGYIPFPMNVLPPIIRVYIDGVVVRCPNLGYDLAIGKGCQQARIAPKKLQKLMISLSKNKWLHQSSFIPCKKGELISEGGGIFYVRYQSKSGEVFLGTWNFPDNGPIADLVKEIGSYWPEHSTDFIPPVGWHDEKRLQIELFNLRSKWDAENEQR